MLVLRKGDESYNLFTRPEHTIGRFGDLQISNDQSVSRQHAAISISVVNCRPKIVLRDLQSKYGTYVNEGISTSKAISESSSTVLKVGDKIRFGMQFNTWTLEQSSFIICTSVLTVEEKNTLESIVSKLNGNIYSEWTDNCSYLTMNQLKITVKAMCALGKVKPIVSMNYWENLTTTLKSRKETPIPNCDDHVPPINEEKLNSSRVSLKMNNERRTLFKDTTFLVFGDNLMSEVSPMVEAAGGKAVNGTTTNVSEEDLCSKKVIVVQDNQMATTSKGSRVLKMLNKNSLRPVKSSEICLSIIYCSTQDYCNPAFDAAAIFMQPDSQVSIRNEATVLAADTQDDEMSQSTQFGEPNSGNFSLAVNEKIVLSDSEGDNIIASTDLSVIEDSSSQKIPQNRRIQPFINILKRKSDTPAESPPVSKNSKHDIGVISKKPAVDSSSSNNAESIFGNRNVVKKNTKDLFNFRTDRKVAEKNSSSVLFSSKNESSIGCSTSSIFNKVGTTSFSGAYVKTEKDDPASNLNAMNERRRSTRNSVSIYSAAGTSKKLTSELNKRRREDELDGSPAKTKRFNFEMSRVFNRKTDPLSDENCIVPDSDKEPSDSLIKQASNLCVSSSISENQITPVEIPTTISLSQFIDVTNKPQAEIKQEMNDTTVVQEAPKPTVHKIPLIKNGENIARRSVNGTDTNFKRFQKNNTFHINPTNLNTTCELRPYRGRQQSGIEED